MTMDWRLAGEAAGGGAIGSLARFWLSSALTRGSFPTGTLVVNVLGCILIGALMFGGLAGGWLSADGRVFLVVGILGGFTTMSSFSYETTALMAEGEFVLAFGYFVATLALCFAGVLIGRVVGLAVWGAR